MKVVFATETLSLGINMPAKTVVIEDLWKFQGERHEILTPGEYTQLTGRAGTARDRRAGPRGRGLPAAGPVRAGGRARGHPDVRPGLVVPALVQHGGQPGPQLHARAGAPAAELVVRPVPGRPRRRGAGADAPAGSRGARRLPQEHGVRPRGLRGVLGLPREGAAAPRRGPSGPRTGPRGTTSARAWRALRPGDVDPGASRAAARGGRGGVVAGREADRALAGSAVLPPERPRTSRSRRRC